MSLHRPPADLADRLRAATHASQSALRALRVSVDQLRTSMVDPPAEEEVAAPSAPTSAPTSAPRAKRTPDESGAHKALV